MRGYRKEDAELQTLLDLNNESYWLNNRYWIKFEAYKVNKTKEVPHGIKYSLTLHDSNNTRVLGFDNAHAYKPKKKKYGCKKTTWDHKHKAYKVEPYEFESASQLIEDFWSEVNKIIS